MIRAFIELRDWLDEHNLAEGVKVIIESPNAHYITSQLKTEHRGYMVYDSSLAQQENTGEIMGIPFEIREVKKK